VVIESVGARVGLPWKTKTLAGASLVALFQVKVTTGRSAAFAFTIIFFTGLLTEVDVLAELRAVDLLHGSSEVEVVTPAMSVDLVEPSEVQMQEA
jgi:hypothetical protein